MGMTLGDVASGIAADRVATLTAREEEAFRSHRTRSREMWREATEVIPRGVPCSFQDAPPQPVFIEHGQGSRVWDVDGNEYVDFHNGFGVMIVGHAHPAIIAAVEAQLHRGSHFAQPVAENVVVARELARRFQQPQWRFTNSGTESTLDAVRLARGFTGRERIIKIEASYHGHHDALLVSVEPPHHGDGSRAHADLRADDAQGSPSRRWRSPPSSDSTTSTRSSGPLPRIPARSRA